jgi:hypothetical protein
MQRELQFEEMELLVGLKSETMEISLVEMDEVEYVSLSLLPLQQALQHQ